MDKNMEIQLRTAKLMGLVQRDMDHMMGVLIDWAKEQPADPESMYDSGRIIGNVVSSIVASLIAKIYRPEKWGEVFKAIQKGLMDHINRGGK